VTEVKLLNGTVSAVRATTAISGGGNDSAVQTTHILLFKVDGKQAKMSSMSPAMISEGDVVVLAGTEKQGAFNVLAYRNETTAVVGDVGKARSVLGMIVGFGGSLVALVVFVKPKLGLIPIFIGLLFLLVGCFSAARFTKIRAATRLLGA